MESLREKMKGAKVLLMKARMKNHGLKMFWSWVIFPKRCLQTRASDLLPSTATSRDFLFCTPRGQLLWNKRIISVTNIAELVEYNTYWLSHNDDVTKPRELNTFLDVLAELGVYKALDQEEKGLSDLIDKEKGYRNVENTAQNESNVFFGWKWSRRHPWEQQRHWKRQSGNKK